MAKSQLFMEILREHYEQILVRPTTNGDAIFFDIWLEMLQTFNTFNREYHNTKAVEPAFNLNPINDGSIQIPQVRAGAGSAGAELPHPQVDLGTRGWEIPGGVHVGGGNLPHNIPLKTIRAKLSNESDAKNKANKAESLNALNANAIEKAYNWIRSKVSSQKRKRRKTRKTRRRRSTKRKRKHI